ncbi:glycosyltransferase family 2 protein [Megamonas sp.]|uniref:glycosyltransferase family 2 protein n=1 Tax=Megamonas sp. TaxID=2049033 RepID=UPI00257CD785|nr:glycosyltransferase family 2 protein [Megamonas sp.]MBS5780315.1 glycosyltransferase family 2 protein [Megamonas sp.]
MSKVLSVIIPIYNGEKYIKRCLNSVLEQTVINLIEIIIINDGSTDNTEAICIDYKNKYDNIIYSSIENKGVSNARNVGIHLSKTQYITFLDADDWIEKDMYEILLKRILKFDLDIVIGGYVKDYNSKIVNRFKKSKLTNYNRLEAQKNLLKNKIFGWEMCDKIYRKDILKEIAFDNDLIICEDLLFQWHLFKKVKRVGFIPIYKYHYCYNLDSATNGCFNKKYLSGIKVKIRIYKEAKLIDYELSKLALENYFDELGIVCINMMKHNYILLNRFKCYQKIVRKNIIKILKAKGISKKHKLGLCFLVLPYIFCKKIWSIRKYLCLKLV